MLVQVLQNALWHPAAVFGTTGGLLASLWGLSQSATGTGPASPVPLPLVVGLSAVLAGLIGTLCWSLIVGRLGRWTRSVRGCLAGGVTLWLSLSVLVPAVVLIEQVGLSGLTPTVLLEAAALAGLVATVGSVFVGWVVIPVGAVVGYALSCQ
jgi:hypothetical protein